MFNNRKDSSGIITVFLTLMLVPLLALGTLVMEVGRYASAKELIAEAQVTASMSILADYNVYFQERFGLLAIDPNDKQYDNFVSSLKYNTDNVGEATFAASKLVNLKEDSIEFESIFTLSDFNVLKRQILEYSKYSVPYTILNDALDLKGKILNGNFIAKLTGIDIKLITQMVEKSEKTTTGIEQAFKDLGAYECAVLDVRNFFGESNTSSNYKNKELYDLYIKEDGFLGFIGGDDKEPIKYTDTTNYNGRYQAYMKPIYDKQTYINTHEDPAQDLANARSAYNAFTYSTPSENRLLAEIAIYQYVSKTENEGKIITSTTKEVVNVPETYYRYSTDSNNVSVSSNSSENHTVKIIDAINTVGKAYGVPQTTLDEIRSHEALASFADAYDITSSLSSRNKTTLKSYYSNANKKNALNGLVAAQTERKRQYDADIAGYNSDIDAAASGYIAALNSAYSKLKTLSDTLVPAITSLEVAKEEFINSKTVDAPSGVAIDTGIKDNTSNAGEVEAAIDNTIAFLRGIKDGAALTTAMSLVSNVKTNVTNVKGASMKSIKASSGINYINGTQTAVGIENDKLKGYVSKDFSKIDTLCSVKAIKTGNNVSITDNINTNNLSLSNIWDLADQIFNIYDPVPAVYNSDYVMVLDQGTIDLFPKNTPSASYAEDQEYIKSVYDDVERVLGEAYANQLKDINASNVDRNDFATEVQKLKAKLQEIKEEGSGLLSDGLLSAIKKIGKILVKLAEAAALAVRLLGTLVDFFKTLAEQSYYAALVNTYIVQKFPSRLNSIDGATTYPIEITSPVANHGYFSSACVEYAVIGNKSEITNQSSVFWIIFGIRALINCIQILLDPDTMSMISGCNFLAPVVFLGFLYMETNIDMNSLLRLGDGVPLIKGTLHLSAKGIKNVIDKMASIDGHFVSIAASGNGKKYHRYDGDCPTLRKGYTTILKTQALKEKREPCKRCKPGKAAGSDDDFLELDYDKYLWLLLFLISGDTKLQRIANMAQMETRYYEYEKTANSSSFLLKNAGTYIRSEVTVEYDSLLPIISLGKNTNTFLDIYNLEYVGY